MKNILKWLVIIGGVFIVVLVAAGMIFVKTFDVKKYKPQIEKAVTDNTGRRFSVGDDIDLSVFPWVGVKLTNLHFGNPDGFGQADMVSVENFEVRLKVMPLLSKQIEVKTFVLDRPQIYLEKTKNGQANWQGLSGKKGPAEKKSPEPVKEKSGSPALPIESLVVGSFAITNGKLIYVDEAAGTKKEIADMNLTLANVSFENPIDISMSAKVDGKPISLKGKAGPIGKEPGKGTVALDFVLKALEKLEVKLAGKVTDPVDNLSFDLGVEVAQFSPRGLMKALGQELPLKSKDPSVLNALSIKASARGNKNAVSVSGGKIVLDDSTFEFTASAREFDKPDLAFDVRLDSMDLDRYLPEPPPKAEKGEAKAGTKTETSKEKKAEQQIDYTPLRKLVLDGKFSAGKLKASGATVENLLVKLDAKNGIISMDPLSADLYEGSMASKLNLNVQKNKPLTTAGVTLKTVQAGPLLRDVMKKDLIEGALNADINVSMKGDDPTKVKKTLNGQGSLLFVDGAVVGIDLANAVRNVKVNLGLVEQQTEKPRTDFAELKVPFTITNGLVNTPGSSLASPLLRVGVKGDINLVQELLDLRVDPKFVATLKGQGDTKDRSGLMVPVDITGPFSKPKIRPDLKSMITEGSLPKTQDLKNVLGTKEDQKKTIESLEQDVKKQIKSLIPGFN